MRGDVQDPAAERLTGLADGDASVVPRGVEDVQHAVAAR